MTPTCRVCGSIELIRLRESSIQFDLNSDNFAITDDHYGMTGAIDGCKECKFLQCTDVTDVTAFYEALEDQGYEDSRQPRVVQMDRLLKEMLSKSGGEPGTLIDVGAGSGILVEAAVGLGFVAQGVEPSNWLADQAKNHGLPVIQGVLPHREITDKVRWVTCIDVIEHVEDPLGMVNEMAKVLADDGLCVMVTPDVDSWAAKFLGDRWWHYRIAHIGYFTPKTLDHLMARAGFVRVKLWRPSWYFQIGYLASRLGQYLPFDPSKLLPGFLKSWQIPLNLRDSIIGIYKRG